MVKMLRIFYFLGILYVIFKLFPEMADRARHRPRRGISERTNRISFNFLRHIYQQVDVFQMPVAVFKTVQYFFHPSRPLPAGAALATRFVMIEACKIP